MSKRKIKEKSIIYIYDIFSNDDYIFKKIKTEKDIILDEEDFLEISSTLKELKDVKKEDLDIDNHILITIKENGKTKEIRKRRENLFSVNVLNKIMLVNIEDTILLKTIKEELEMQELYN